jgi:hypothetical protein
MIENVLTLHSCIYVQKYNCMNDNYYFCLIDRIFILELCGWIEIVALIHKGLKYTNQASLICGHRPIYLHMNH